MALRTDLWMPFVRDLRAQLDSTDFGQNLHARDSYSNTSWKGDSGKGKSGGKGKKGDGKKGKGKKGGGPVASATGSIQAFEGKSNKLDSDSD